MRDLARRILIVVGTYNRRDLTGITLDSISRCKTGSTAVVIMDDASTEYPINWLQRWNWPVVPRERSIGVGPAAFERYKFFVESYPDCDYLCALDNDLQFASGFDLRLRGIWEAHEDPAKSTLLSGYRSMRYNVQKEIGGCVKVDWVGGAAHFVDRETATKIVKSNVVWDAKWDLNVSNLMETKLCPKQSLVQHLGIYGSGFNGMSCDVAHDFPGENQWD